MEQNSFNNSISGNGISLQLRSKEVSEVMGNIPAWIGSWGAFLIIFLFAASMFLFLNIQFIERIPGMASINSRNIEAVGQQQQNFFLRVVVPANEFSKIKTREYVMVSFKEGKSNSYKLNVIKFPVDKKKFNKDCCFVQFSLNPVTVDKMRREEPALNTVSNVDCQLQANISIFQKVWNDLFY